MKRGLDLENIVRDEIQHHQWNHVRSHPQPSINRKKKKRMITLQCQAILFDLDGTLIESTGFIEQLWQNWGTRHGISPKRISEVMHGRRAGEIISLVAPHLPLKEEVYALETDEINNMAGMRVYPGARELLNALHPKQWAIVTSGSLRVASARLNYAKLPTPEVFVTGGDVKTGKPSPEGFLLAASRLGVRPSECIVVEDAPAGVQAGKAAGMKVIAIASTVSKELLNQADVIVQKLGDIKLNRMNREITIQIQ
jgi:sugar-phosphatase